MRRRSTSRAGERGFTLVEVLVSLALLGIVGTVLGVVFSIGMRPLLAPGASQDRLGAASYAIAIEQPLTEDVHRASCIQYSGNPPVGSCYLPTLPNQAICSSGPLCIWWPDLANSDQCDMALYTLSPNPGSRQEYSGSTETATTFPGVTVMIKSTSVSPLGALGMDVGITSEGPHPARPPASPLANPPTVTLDLQSLADVWPALPPSPSAGVSTSPC